MIPVIHGTSFPTIQILVNYQIRKRKDLWIVLQRSAKKKMTTWSLSLQKSDEKKVDSKIHHCCPEKMRLKGKRIWGCYDPDVYHNFNHFAIKDNSFSIEDNLQLSSKNEVEINDVLEVLPGLFPCDPVTDHFHKFIPWDNICVFNGVFRRWFQICSPQKCIRI